MQLLLQSILEEVKTQGRQPPSEQVEHYAQSYLALLKQAENECPAPDKAQNPSQRGQPKRSKSRNLSERPHLYEHRQVA